MNGWGLLAQAYVPFGGASLRLKAGAGLGEADPREPIMSMGIAV